MNIRKYEPSDCRCLMELFYHTVHTVNAKDYTTRTIKRMGNWGRRTGPNGISPS